MLEPTVLQTPAKLRGKPIAGAEDRQRKIAGFDQAVFSKSSVVAVGAGGIARNRCDTRVVFSTGYGTGTVTISSIASMVLMFWNSTRSLQDSTRGFLAQQPVQLHPYIPAILALAGNH